MCVFHCMVHLWDGYLVRPAHTRKLASKVLLLAAMQPLFFSITPHPTTTYICLSPQCMYVRMDGWCECLEGNIYGYFIIYGYMWLFLAGFWSLSPLGQFCQLLDILSQFVATCGDLWPFVAIVHTVQPHPHFGLSVISPQAIGHFSCHLWHSQHFIVAFSILHLLGNIMARCNNLNCFRELYSGVPFGL